MRRMADKDSRAGERYADRAILEYVERVHAPHDPGLTRAFEAPEATGMPAIQVGASEGRLLELLLRLIGAARVVEIGTLAGYSAIRMARALPATGKLWTIESESQHAAVARDNIRAAGLERVIEVVEGPALDVLPSLERHGPFDAVFIDADKVSYAHYGAWAARHTRRGGLLLGDNAFVFGELLDDTDRGRAMRAFHEDAREHFDTVCVPTPDGLLVGVRK
jgi:caffeoyl-CoA O-methyltransferase